MIHINIDVYNKRKNLEPDIWIHNLSDSDFNKIKKLGQDYGIQIIDEKRLKLGITTFFKK